MNKKEIKNRLSKLGFNSHYSGKNKTFYIDNCTKHYQCLLFEDILSSGFNLVKN